MSATTRVQHGEEVREVPGCLDVCIAELAKAGTIAHDVTPYL